MAKKKYVVPAELIWQVKKPRFNGFACGHGPHRSKKVYDRKDKSWRREL